MPYVRGPIRHRNYKDILREIKQALDNGINRITLLGQNVNAYEYEDINFIRLVKLVDAVKGLKEFSFITSHPKDASRELFQVMQDSEKLTKYFHLPAQAGSDRILKLMNRGYTRKIYLDLIGDYRRIVKDAALSTDIIVGFPSETEGDFQDTLNLMKEASFDCAYIFKYSVRPHAAAFNLADDVSREEKEARHAKILGLQKEISGKLRFKNHESGERCEK